MALIRLLFRMSRATVLSAAVLAILEGAANCGLIVTVQQALFGSLSGRDAVLQFLVLVVAVNAFSYLSQKRLANLVHQTTMSLRVDLCLRILASPLLVQERVGTPRLFSAITDELATLANDLNVMPPGIAGIAVVLPGVVYLGYLSIPLLGVLLVTLGGIVISHMILGRSRRPVQNASIALRRTLFDHINGVLHGATELRLNRRRRFAFLDGQLFPATNALTKRLVALAGNDALGTVLLYTGLWLVIGVILLAPGQLANVSQAVRSSYIFTLLFLFMPAQNIGRFANAIRRGAITLRAIEQLSGSFLSPKPTTGEIAAPPFERALDLRAISFSYRSDDKTVPAYAVGPIDLTIARGETLFLVGGNGSGKTTLGKIICGLYAPDAGTLSVDDTPVVDLEAYRQLFTAIFADFYVFEQLLGVETADVDAEATRIIDELELGEKVRVEGSRFSTLKLSHGQRRRLALVAARLEGRPIYVFDEWAADQDPRYRRLFYEQILPALKRAGRTCIVITHDDRYFDRADRVVVMDQGRITRIFQPAMQSADTLAQ